MAAAPSGSMKPLSERIARALCRSDGHPEDIKFEGRPMWESYSTTAIAVLTAMKGGANEAMIKAGQNHLSPDKTWPAHEDGIIDERHPADIAGVWSSMIDIAIAETTKTD